MSVLNKVTDRVLEKGHLYTPEELMVRLKFIIGICLTLTLMGIIFTILYSVIFVAQPLKAIAPIDQKFFEVIIPVASFLCGILSGIMLNSSNAQALDAVQKTMANFKDAGAQAAKAPEQPKIQSPVQAPVKRQEPVLETVAYNPKEKPEQPPHPEIT